MEITSEFFPDPVKTNKENCRQWMKEKFIILSLSRLRRGMTSKPKVYTKKNIFNSIATP